MNDWFQTLAVMLRTPKTRVIALAALRKQYGNATMERARQYAGEFRRRGFAPVDAELAGIAIIVGTEELHTLAQWGPTWAQNQAQLPQRRTAMQGGAIAGWGRVFTAIATGGASEAARVVSDDVDDFMDKFEDAIEEGAESAADFLVSASTKGWDNFKDAVEEVIDTLDVTEIDSFKDVLDIVKTSATLGLDEVVTKTLDAIQEAILELIEPYLRRAGEFLGRIYGEGKTAVTKHVYNWADAHLNKVAANILREIVGALYDLLLGYPPCVCEQGCIAPIAKGLKEADNPYVKAVGEALTVIWPFAQGRGGEYNPNFPQASACLYFYANRQALLPSAKLPEGAKKAISAIGEDVAMGMPRSYEVYKAWLVDEVARGADGPRFLASGEGGNTSKYYFDHPSEAIDVIKKAEMISGWIEKVATYVKWIEMAYTYGCKAIDAYDAIKNRDFGGEFDLDKLKAAVEDLTAEDVLKFAEETGCRIFIGGEAECERIKKQVQDKIDTASAVADQYMTGKEALEKGITKEDVLRQLPTMPGPPRFMTPNPGISGVDVARATMGEWQVAEIGLEARAKWNDMAKTWCDMTQDQRFAWKSKGDSVWKSQATDYGRWFDLFRDDENLRDYCLYQQLKKQTPSVIATLKDKAERRAVGSLRPNVIEAMQSMRAQEIGKAIQNRAELTKRLLPYTTKYANIAAGLLPKKQSKSLGLTSSAILNTTLKASQLALQPTGGSAYASAPTTQKKSATTPIIVGGLGLLGAVALVVAATGRKK